MKMYGGGIVPPFLTLALDGGEGSDSCPSHLPLQREHLVPIGLEAGWAPELVSMLWGKKKSLAPARNWTPGIQLLAHCYTNWAIPASFLFSVIFLSLSISKGYRTEWCDNWWIMNWKELGRKQLWSNEGSIPAFAARDWG
jgi:hypothetical protein